ncbi:Spx/MgsR family RNA polymerase-binding regulatory protein [Lactococcus petauri]|uniref:Spx/MgsR family RNA polymerase-binding regulatory protein n=1 Tax=Lactococcus petauri TaxID=1940789 RepID=UPI002078D15D|nr:Spx/MgsR family RNA polymerase-binding regulatory protein [Lactococcus petauri]USI67609.1 Spx/MgsR family RNA polymerase-binding regulatory protein [Lactococcus petauri]WJE12270.1 Spx/MgsR family RNA polymerase-binding regulatory protein [Lactococcus petauri]
MLKVYTTSSCYSCRKAIQWVKKQGIPYKEINLATSPLKKEELLTLLSLTDEGVEEIIAKQSYAFKELMIDLDTIKLDTLLDFIIEYPTLLRRPLITDDLKIQTGYNDEDIRKFLPRKLRKVHLKMITENLSYNK